MTDTPTTPPAAASGSPGGTAVHVFLGKGGVGKTTCAAATALGLARAARDTLVISTDPTPSLSHIYELERGAHAPEIAPHLAMREIGLAEVRAMWDEQFGRDVYSVFSAFVDIPYETFVEFMTSVLPGLGEEFMVDDIRRLAAAGTYGHVVWDTAPLGQTLALLGTPQLLAEHLRMAPRVYAHLRTSGASRESLMDVLRRWTVLSGACMDFLRERVRFSLVVIAEALAVRQVDGVLGELGRYGLGVHRVIVNNVITTVDSSFLSHKAEEQQVQLRILRERLGDIPIVEVPLFPHEIRGMDRLAEVAAALGGVTAAERA
jgi:arsenite-transporting ATPase